MSVSLYGSGNTVIQVVNGTLGGAQVSTASTSFVTTGLTATITPQSTNSKILILANLNQCYINSSTYVAFYTVYRGASNIAPTGTSNGQSFACVYNSAGAPEMGQPIIYLDSPASTSALTYTIYFATNGGGTAYLNANSGTSTLALLEISGS